MHKATNKLGAIFYLNVVQLTPPGNDIIAQEIYSPLCVK